MLFAKNYTVIDLINRKACLDILKGPVLYSKSADETNESEISLKKFLRSFSGIKLSTIKQQALFLKSSLKITLIDNQY